MEEATASVKSRVRVIEEKIGKAGAENKGESTADNETVNSHSPDVVRTRNVRWSAGAESEQLRRF